jgi:chorismate synthase
VSYNTFGKQFRITTYGESHGAGIGVIIDGCPSGLHIDESFIKSELLRRRPGQSRLVTERNEKEDFQIISGIYAGQTSGTPINIFIPNKDTRSKDYSNIKDVYRPSHADYVYEQKYGLRDHRGGGRSSARETAARVAAGAIAKLILKQHQIEIIAYCIQIGELRTEILDNYKQADQIETSMVRCPDPETSQKMIELLEQLQAQGDTCGGIIQCECRNVPVGLGEPIYDRLNAALGSAMLSINACKGVEFGSGFNGSSMKGSEHNDAFDKDASGRVITTTNYSGGIQGGISNGMPIVFNVAFKPISSIKKQQSTLDKLGENKTIEISGRHDPCVVPRAVPIVEAMAAITLVDFLMRSRSDKI